ncbi:MAG: hypothetical protein WD877_02760 [Candidatus Saccharimonadales bacterium]
MSEALHTTPEQDQRPKWSIVEGHWPITDLPGKEEVTIQLNKLKEFSHDLPESAALKSRVSGLLMYGLRICRPELFYNSSMIDAVEKDLDQATVACSQYTNSQRESELKRLAGPEVKHDTPIVAFINFASLQDGEFVDRDTRALAEGVVRYLHLEQSGRKDELPQVVPEV